MTKKSKTAQQHEIPTPSDEAESQSNLAASFPMADMGALAEETNARKQAEDELRRVKEALEAANRDLQTALTREKYLARTDTLTSINNRRYLFELADHEFDVAMRYQQPLSVILFDLDALKQINDRFGHAAGDQMLERVAQVACAELRSVDVIGRYGGDEFVVLLPVTNAQQAFVVAERIRAGVAAIRLPTGQQQPATVTISIGIAEIRRASPQDETVEDIIRRADQALYAVKRAGKNGSVIFERKEH